MRKSRENEVGSLKYPPQVQGRVENSLALERMKEIQAIIERIDLRWDNGFMSAEEYLEKLRQLEREVESLRPIDYDEIRESADLIQNFRLYWDQCGQTDDPEEARKQLLDKIIERVFVHDGRVLAVVLHGDFSVVLGKDDAESELIAGALEIKMATSISRSQIGDDGPGTLTDCAVFTGNLSNIASFCPKCLLRKIE